MQEPVWFVLIPELTALFLGWKMGMPGRLFLILSSGFVCLFFGLGEALSTLFWLWLMIGASREDLASRTVSDKYAAGIALLGIGRISFPIGGRELLLFLGALALLCIPMIGTNFLPGGRGIGGADLKYTLAQLLFLGAVAGTAATLLGFLLAIVIEGIRKKGERREGFALIPYLSAAGGAVHLLGRLLSLGI